ncbi:hypothetical protein BT96DRAFT_990653 [Gymnopus androsaceus JB14]|uniref:Uncharacterized protein n=1 Tax=Gymnopus androsaceus JB14 TaxID=1447944 RepID=A0A6A4I2A2_9AGAR|nr:hypothetical protein BT96DRAFT_990653 [Gymnopus androsaceus JB14]
MTNHDLDRSKVRFQTTSLRIEAKMANLPQRACYSFASTLKLIKTTVASPKSSTCWPSPPSPPATRITSLCWSKATNLNRVRHAFQFQLLHCNLPRPYRWILLSNVRAVPVPGVDASKPAPETSAHTSTGHAFVSFRTQADIKSDTNYHPDAAKLCDCTTKEKETVVKEIEKYISADEKFGPKSLSIDLVARREQELRD